MICRRMRTGRRDRSGGVGERRRFRSALPAFESAVGSSLIWLNCSRNSSRAKRLVAHHCPRARTATRPGSSISRRACGVLCFHASGSTYVPTQRRCGRTTKLSGFMATTVSCSIDAVAQRRPAVVIVPFTVRGMPRRVATIKSRSPRICDGSRKTLHCTRSGVRECQIQSLESVL